MKEFVKWMGDGARRMLQYRKRILHIIAVLTAFYLGNRLSWLYGFCYGSSQAERMMALFANMDLVFSISFPSFNPVDLGMGILTALIAGAILYLHETDARKYRHGREFGSARWGTRADIKPYINPVFRDNVILTNTERLTMESRPKNPKYARNKNCLVIGGSGSGKSRFFVKPNLMQMGKNVSYIVTDPKGQIIVECGKMMVDEGYNIKVFNTINFRKSMRYNPFAYVRHEVAC